MSGSDARPFEVAESSSLRVLWVLLPLLAVLGVGMWAQLHDNRSETPWMEVTLSPPFFLMGGSAAWSLAVIVLMGIGLGWAFFRRRVELAGNVLDVRSTLYRRRTPVADLLLDQAEVVDLSRDRRYGIRFKTNGYSMPGFYSGHFRLQGGGKGFALVTDRARTLVIPVRGGSTLLLSLERPQALLEALRKVAATAPRQ
ncbi:PH domain-containing protein [Stenotrophomonas indicatrix]|uniref:PH domain-containing protein n=1 Tax=Stenotrophomonas indicatrix TaxID=2045451 RepID=UPI001C4F960A|nr:PH domain-containing protein [Stenotrophomonas indicatrix]MDN8650117.1 PH domain-containing protein [Stenotrophomonas indicatrix]QXQ03651.1 PH domain-containing protein [Stenotrophomonas indicatrix]